MSIWQTDLVVVNSSVLADYWRGLAGSIHTPIRVVPNLLADWRFEEAAPYLPGERRRVVTVGALKPVKGHRILIEAVGDADRLRNELEIVFVGEGQERQALQKLALEKGVQLRLVGEVADTRRWLGSCWVYAQPSLSEGVSNATLEAMASACPVIVSDVGGMRDMLGSSGILVPAGDAAAIARTLTGLLDSPERVEALGRQARRRALELAGPETILAAYQQAYLKDEPCAG